MSSTTPLTHFQAPTVKPGVSFKVKGIGGFEDKVEKATEYNYHGIGALQGHEDAKTNLIKLISTKQSAIRKGGLTHPQANEILHKVYAKSKMLTTTQKNALQKIVHHLTKTVIPQTEQNTQEHGITALANVQTNKAKVSQVGDTMKVVHQGNESHAAGGIASAMRNLRNSGRSPINSSGPQSGSSKPPIIKLSI